MVKRFLAVALLVLLSFGSAAYGADLKIGIMQAQAGDAKKYQPLLDYLAQKGIPASFVTASTYPAAADMFSKGQVDAMFSGSGIAGAMIIKGVADPLVRPVSQEGTSTYWAAVVVKKGGEKFTPTNDYFSGKRVIFTSLASSGEFYFRSLGESKAKELMLAASHGAALDALSRDQADVAIVKNRVWDKEKSKYEDLEQVGKDSGENPDNTLIISKKLSKATADKLSTALLGLGNDTSSEAKAVMASMKIEKFIKTTPADFKSTLALLKKAGVNKSFNFKY
jgi:ABC-type phosphate/phosphonate transport system substrate-binding protein